MANSTVMLEDPNSLALLSNAETAEADRLTITNGTPGRVLMENAGAAVARAAAVLAPRRGRIAVLNGPGNNGGDGFVAARLLARQGFDVSVGLLGGLDRLRGDAALAASQWRGQVSPIASFDLDGADLAIDALFGAGLGRDLDGEAKAIVERLNAWTVRTLRSIIAVDIPSGIDGSSGGVRGVAVKASRTVTFFRRKPGHLLLPGRIYCGSTSIADIGIDASVLAAIVPKTFVNAPALWLRHVAAPRADGHKYSRGHALVVSGSLAHTGAARLAARGALRAGAGLVTVATPAEALPAHAAALTAIMTRVCDSPADLADLLADRRKNALVMGPGLGVGETTKAFARTALSAAKPGDERRGIVLDADALTSFSGDALTLACLIRQSCEPVVLTPHEGEFARLFGGIPLEEEGQWATLLAVKGNAGELIGALSSRSKLERARAAAALTGAAVILKGADTVVAHPDGRASIGEDLPPWLATAGSGDVLAGIVGGLLAQGMPLFEATCAAVYMHGAAARHFGPGLIAEDIPENLPPVLRKLFEEIACP